MRKQLGPKFFDRRTLTVARELLGKYLVRRIGTKEIALMITETEAYDGFNDLASHARRGKTPRNTPMFAEAGTIYVYFTYGMHWMLNIVCGKKEYPAAVLIRGIASIPNVYDKWPTGQLYYTPGRMFSGPAKLTKFLKIDKTLNNTMLGKKSGLWIEDRGVKISPRAIMRTGRIGVEYSGIWAKKPWRFVLKNNATIAKSNERPGRRTTKKRSR